MPLTRSSQMPADLVPRVFCDMDGVVADFHTPIVRKYKLGGSSEVNKFLAQPNVWHTIAKDWPNLFATLPLMPDAKQLMKTLIQLRDKGHIKLAMLTAVPTEWYADRSKRDTTRRDKQRWISTHFPEIDTHNVIVCRRSDKVKYALKQRSMGTHAPVLIDDFDKNIREWHSVGDGIGILHRSAASSITELHQYLRAIGDRK